MCFKNKIIYLLLKKCKSCTSIGTLNIIQYNGNDLCVKRQNRLAMVVFKKYKKRYKAYV